MNEYEALRREIECRLLRETIYRAVDAMNTKEPLKPFIERNDEIIKLIGAYLKENHRDRWEDHYLANGPK